MTLQSKCLVETVLANATFEMNVSDSPPIHGQRLPAPSSLPSRLLGARGRRAPLGRGRKGGRQGTWNEWGESIGYAYRKLRRSRGKKRRWIFTTKGKDKKGQACGGEGRLLLKLPGNTRLRMLDSSPGEPHSFCYRPAHIIWRPELLWPRLRQRPPSSPAEPCVSSSLASPYLEEAEEREGERGG